MVIIIIIIIDGSLTWLYNVSYRTCLNVILKKQEKVQLLEYGIVRITNQGD